MVSPCWLVENCVRNSGVVTFRVSWADDGIPNSPLAHVPNLAQGVLDCHHLSPFDAILRWDVLLFVVLDILEPTHDRKTISDKKLRNVFFVTKPFHLLHRCHYL